MGVEGRVGGDGEEGVGGDRGGRVGGDGEEGVGGGRGGERERKGEGLVVCVHTVLLVSL